MILIAFILGGICGYVLAAVMCISSENLENKQLRMENEAIKQDRDYWKYQALGARRLHPRTEVASGGGSDGEKVSK